MSLVTSRIVGAHLAVVFLLASAVSVYGQQAPARPNQTPGNQFRQNQAQPGRPGAAPFQAQQRVTANRPVEHAQAADREVAQWLGICNQEEIAMARLAASKAKDKDVKEFAEMLAKAHSDHLAQLQRFGAQSAALEAGANANRDANAPRAANQPGNPIANQTRTTGANQGGIDFLEAKREIAERCLASAQQKWNEEKADECEMGFVGAQLVAHEHMLNTEKVLRQHASPELQSVIDQGIQATEKHMKQAKDLLHSLAAAERKSDRDSK